MKKYIVTISFEIYTKHEDKVKLLAELTTNDIGGNAVIESIERQDGYVLTKVL